LFEQRLRLGNLRHFGCRPEAFERLDLDVLEKRFSDLSSMWLGESEKAIAALSKRPPIYAPLSSSTRPTRSCAIDWRLISLGGHAGQ
jgi:hypothetical protein